MWIVIVLLAMADLLAIFACVTLSGKISRLEEEILMVKLGNSTISEEALIEP